MAQPKSVEGGVPVEYIDLFLADKRVPEPAAILGGVDHGEDTDTQIPTPQELAQAPDIQILLEACKNLPEYGNR